MKVDKNRSKSREEHKKRKYKKDNKQLRIPRNSLAKQNIGYLSFLARNSKHKNRRSKLIDIASNKEISAISECLKNVLKGDLPFSKNHLKQLKRHKIILRDVAKKCYPIKKKRLVLKQKGGFLAGILPIALKALGGLGSMLLSSVGS